MFTQARRRLKRRIHMTLLLVTMILLLVTSSATSWTSAKTQCPGYWRVKVFYYTNASMTYQCGTKAYWCDGNVISSGCSTDYYIIRECECAE